MTPRLLAACVLAAATLGVAPARTLAQPPGLLVGHVIDTVGAAVSGAEVRVVSASGVARIAFTNSLGQWSMRFDAGAAWYRVSVRSIGFAPARFSVAGGGASLVAVNVQLRAVLLTGVVAVVRLAPGGLA